MRRDGYLKDSVAAEQISCVNFVFNVVELIAV